MSSAVVSYVAAALVSTDVSIPVSTEAAAVACVYAALVTRFVFRELSWRDILDASAATVFFTAQILIVVACAGVFSWLLTVNQVPATLVAWLKGADVAPWQFLLAVNVLFLVVGCFLDTGTALLVLSPLLLPIAKQIGVDPIHFGVIVVMNLTIGGFHPPFGLNIFVFQALFKTTSGTEW